MRVVMTTIAVKLKQHTPIIHFQHYQNGALLRTSELKPKLDKFLIKKLNMIEFKTVNGKQVFNPKLIYESFFNNKEKQSLDYRMRIEYNGDIKYDYIEQPKRENGTFKQKIKDDNTISTETRSYPLFFGNMGKDFYKNHTVKKFVFAENIIMLSISSFNDDLLKIIKEHFSEFLALENFGSRQDKGFGSYYVDKTDEKYREVNESIFDYKFEINTSGVDLWTKFRNLFYQVDLFYRSLRSGINLKDDRGKDKFYFKSLLFLYFKNKGIQWEKKTIKEKFFLNDVNRKDGSVLYYGLNSQKKNRPNSNVLVFSSQNKKLVKDLLGLSTNESWLYYKNSITKSEAKYDVYGNIVKKEEDESPIVRFKSPIFLKVIKNDQDKYVIYIKLAENIPIAEKWFIIEEKNKKHSGFPLQLPSNFSLNDFFDFITDKTKFDIKTHVEKQFQSDINGNPNTEFKILENIFENLNKIKKTV